MFQERARRAAITKPDVDSIIDTFSKEDRSLIGMNDYDEQYLTVCEGGYVIFRSLVFDENHAISFFDLLEDGEKSLNVCMGTRRDDRGRGFATKAANQAMMWVEMNKSNIPQDYIHWSALRTNAPSRKLAESLGFKLHEDGELWKPEDEWVLYIYDIH